MQLKKHNMITFKIFILTLLLILIFLSSNGSIYVVANKMYSESSDWNNNRGFVDRIIFNIITSDEDMVNALRNGEIDIVGQFVDVSLIT
ncbi:MAG: hypothetical protein ACXAC7_23665, partial [Candidatus Hodarchaeales archaeon]